MLGADLIASDVRILRITDIAWAYLVSGRYHINTLQRADRGRDWFTEGQESRQRWARLESNLA